jgi:uncharacterized protein YjiS (DUF1127 family)
MREYILHQAESDEGTFAFSPLRRVITNWWKRRTLRKLRDLDDHILFDIGVTRSVLDAVLRLPLSVDHSREFSRWARRPCNESPS